MTATLIVVTGIDGVGKSSLVDGLERLGLLPDCAYLRRPKPPDGNAATLGRLMPRRHGDARDWLGGPFAETMGVALAFDFLAHWEAGIRPALAGRRFVVCDRYDVCFAAYLHAVGSAFPCGELFATLPRPDLAIHVVLAPETLAARQGARGAADDEHPALSAALSRAYADLLPQYAPRHAVVANDGALEDTLSRVAALVRDAGRRP
jgi:thymidylate kinase